MTPQEEFNAAIVALHVRLTAEWEAKEHAAELRGWNKRGEATKELIEKLQVHYRKEVGKTVPGTMLSETGLAVVGLLAYLKSELNSLSPPSESVPAGETTFEKCGPVECVECNSCGFKFAAEHAFHDGTYGCPECGKSQSARGNAETERCRWKDAECGAETACGHEFHFLDGDLSEAVSHWLKFCPYCGKPISLKPESTEKGETK